MRGMHFSVIKFNLNGKKIKTFFKINIVFDGPQYLYDTGTYVFGTIN